MALRIFDTKTGKPLSGMNILLIPKSKCKEKDWLMLYQHPMLLNLVKCREITGTDFRVLLLLIYLSEYDNVVNVTQKYLAEQLGIREQNISRSVRKLEEFHCLSKIHLQGQTVFILSKSLVKKGKKPAKKMVIRKTAEPSTKPSKKASEHKGFAPSSRHEESP